QHSECGGVVFVREIPGTKLAWFEAFAFVANGASSSVSTFTVSPAGELTFLRAATIDGITALDLARSQDGKYLYVLAPGTHGIVTFHIGNDGTLTHITTQAGVPTGGRHRRPRPAPEFVALAVTSVEPGGQAATLEEPRVGESDDARDALAFDLQRHQPVGSMR